MAINYRIQTRNSFRFILQRFILWIWIFDAAISYSLELTNTIRLVDYTYLLTSESMFCIYQGIQILHDQIVKDGLSNLFGGN